MHACWKSTDCESTSTVNSNCGNSRLLSYPFFTIITRAEKDNCKVIMTEKDFFKIKDFNLRNINYLKVKLQIEEKEKLLNKIKKIYENN